MRLMNKVAIITGASSGIGRSSALLFAKEGASLVLVDMDASGGAEVAAAIGASGGKAIFVCADVSKAPEVERLVAATKDGFGKIDIILNCAGILTRDAPFEDMAESVWDRVFNVNVKGSFFTAKYAVPVMKKAGRGVIINIGSLAGVRGGPRTAAYASSKGAVIALTKSMAMELAPFGIRVNCINPGPTGTPMIKSMSDEWRKLVIDTIPLKRLSQPEDIAYAALYLACDESSGVTGTSIFVDGGSGRV